MHITEPTPHPVDAPRGCVSCGDPHVDVLCRHCAREDVLADTSDDSWPPWLPTCPGYLAQAQALVGADWRQVVDRDAQARAGFALDVSSGLWHESHGLQDVRPERVLAYLDWIRTHMDAEIERRAR